MYIYVAVGFTPINSFIHVLVKEKDNFNQYIQNLNQNSSNNKINNRSETTKGNEIQKIKRIIDSDEEDVDASINKVSTSYNLSNIYAMPMKLIIF
jgi:hypothetical protein